MVKFTFMLRPTKIPPVNTKNFYSPTDCNTGVSKHQGIANLNIQFGNLLIHPERGEPIRSSVSEELKQND
jgi:hypothetical protein